MSIQEWKFPSAKMNSEIDRVYEIKTDHEKHEFLEGLLIKKINGISEDPEEIPDDYSHPQISEVERTFMIITESERGFAMEGSVYEGVQELVQHAFRWAEIGMKSTARVIEICAMISELDDEVGDFPIPGHEGFVASDRLNEIRRGVESLSKDDFGCERYLVDFVLKNKEKFGC